MDGYGRVGRHIDEDATAGRQHKSERNVRRRGLLKMLAYHARGHAVESCAALRTGRHLLRLEPERRRDIQAFETRRRNFEADGADIPAG
jgi:hypothetical protein